MIQLRSALVFCVASLVVSSCGGESTTPATGGAGGSGAGGAGGTGAGAGQGGAGITTELFRLSKVSKADLLFMVDNSASMADKQELLAAAVPDLINRLANPGCVDSQGNRIEWNASWTQCPSDHPKREFDPINDIHIGVITSSLGGHGADSCSNSGVGASMWNPRQEDNSHLISRKSPTENVQTYQNKGFLFWDAKGKSSPPGDSDLTQLVNKFASIVQGAGQDGCGFEGSLEAWYRFLIEPVPHQRLINYQCNPYTPTPNNAEGDCKGPELDPQGDIIVDQTVLQQRADFLRSDSLVGIIMLSDENDCSIIDGYQNFLVLQSYVGGNPWQMPRATSQCASTPNAPQCMSCAVGDHVDDTECQKGANDTLSDSLNLRCYRQKQRFGIDFLQPVRRYVDGLTLANPELNTNFGKKDLNPLFCTEYGKDRTECKKVLRDPGLVFLAAIVGVPWQDLAKDPSDLKKGYRPVEQLSWTAATFNANSTPVPAGVNGTTTLWDIIVGKQITGGVEIDYSPTAEPLDPLMIESLDARTGTNPATNSAIAPANAAAPTANVVNGHEWDIKTRADLQYACIFKLPTQRNCSSDTVSCDCAEVDGMNNPLCQSETGEYGKTQYRAKAYPGRRQLAVLRGLPPRQAIAASICAANTTDSNGADFGYRPAVSAIVNQLAQALSGTCWDRQVAYDANYQVPCTVLEGTKYDEGTTACTPCDQIPGRETPDATVLAAVRKDINWIENGLQCACVIPQVSADQIALCIDSAAEPVGVDGWCYVDPSTRATASQSLVANCPVSSKHTLRFVGLGHPHIGSLTFIQCTK